MPRNDAGDGGSGAGHGRGNAPPLQVFEAFRAQRGLDQGAAGGGGEREDAPYDVHGGGKAQVVRAGPRHHRPGRLLQRLLPRLPRLPQAGPPRRGVPGGGGRPHLHGVPQGARQGQHRQRPRPGHRH